MLQLTKRLAAVANFIPKDARVADIGTDHAYIPIYLVKNNITNFCIATDINKGPILKANRNILKYRIDTQHIILKQAKGLQGIREYKLDTIIIAGMGGYLIIDILKNDLDVVKGIKKLILQPQQDIPEVRKFLHMIGFKIDDEVFLEEEGKYYTIISASPGSEFYDQDYEYVYGKILIQKRDNDFIKWIYEKYDKLMSIKRQLSDLNTKSAIQRIKEIDKELLLHSEVMKCIS